MSIRLIEIEPDHLCDRCDHPMRFHAGPDRGSVCMIAEGRVFRGPLEKRSRAKRCWCDGYVRHPESA